MTGARVDWAKDERDVMEKADLVVGVGPLLTDTAQTMTADSERVPNFHELVPGVEVGEAVGSPQPSQTFNALFVAHRVNDAVKGYDDLLATVKEMNDRGFPINLRVRGVPAEEVAAEQQRADSVIGPPEWSRSVPTPRTRRSCAAIASGPTSP